MPCLSQNGGQANQNGLIRIDYAGYSAGDHVFKITNIQRCVITAQYTTLGSSVIESVGIYPYESYYVRVTAPQSAVVYARAKTTTYCDGPVPDRGWVEASSFGNVLAVGFTNITTRRLDASRVEVGFDGIEGATHYVIKVSRDGVNFKHVVIPRSGNRYKVIIKP